MTSAPNLRQRSNGNRGLVFFLLLLLVLSGSACELFRPAQSAEPDKEQKEDFDPIVGREVYDPATGTWVTVREMPTAPMDTVQWRVLPESAYPPITSAGTAAAGGNQPAPPPPPGQPDEFGSQKLSSYQVALLLPFLTDRYQPSLGDIDPNSTWALQFYGGVKLALEDLRSEGVNLQVSVLDTKASEQETARLLQSSPELRSAHMIIGPYRRENIRLVADFAKRQNIAMVSPYSASSGLTQGNPNYIQVSPTLETHVQVLMEHVLNRYSPEQVVLVSTSDSAEQMRLRVLQEEYFRKAGFRAADKLQELILVSNTSDFSDVDITGNLPAQDTLVFVVPSWNENFVYGFLRQVDLTRQSYQEVVVYGMPQWMQFEFIDMDYYEKMHLHVTTPYFIDPLAPAVQFFRRRYFEQYGAVPSLEAFLGYDVMRYFGRMLNTYGTQFENYLDREPAEALHTRFNFQPVVRPTTTGAEQLPVEQYENKFVNILKFENYQFQIIDPN